MGAAHWGRSCEDVEDRLPGGRHARLRQRSRESFFPPRCDEAAGLEEGVGDHCHQDVSVQPGPRPVLEVVEAEFLLELLMRLFADPSCLDGAGERLDRRVGRRGREIIFALAGRAMLANPPTSYTSSPGRCWLPMSRIRWVGPSATRTRKAAKRAPFVPRRQLTCFHGCPASSFSAARDLLSGMWCFPPER